MSESYLDEDDLEELQKIRSVLDEAMQPHSYTNVANELGEVWSRLSYFQSKFRRRNPNHR